MAKSPDQFRQSAGEKIKALEVAYGTLSNKDALLEKECLNLKNEYDNFKTNCLSDDKDASDTTEDSSGTNTDTEGGVKSEAPEAPQNGTISQEKITCYYLSIPLYSHNILLQCFSQDEPKPEKPANQSILEIEFMCHYLLFKKLYYDCHELKNLTSYATIPNLMSAEEKQAPSEYSAETNTDTEGGVKSEVLNKTGYSLFAPIVEKIKSKYFLSDDKGNEVKKCHATSISYKEPLTKCFEIDSHNLKSIESDNCEKIISLHTFLDLIGMDKDDTNHAGFLSFMGSSDELNAVVAPKFDSVIKQYSGFYQKERKVIKHADGQECLEVENGKISTYGENSFSDECAPLINLYMLLQIANDKEIWHYNNNNLRDFDDTEFQNILAFDFTDPDAAG